MAIETEKLVVTLEANIKSYLTSIKKLEDGNKKMFRELKTLIDKSGRQNESAMARMGANMGRNFTQGFSRHIKGALAAFGAGALIKGIASAVKQVADLGDAAQDLGIRAHELQVWNRMAVAAGQNADTMARALSEVAEQAHDADSKLSKLFKVQGRSPTGRVQEDMLVLMRILNKAASAGERLAALQYVFGGRLGRRLAESLRGGPEAFFQEMQRMTDAGELLSPEQLKIAREMEESFNRLGNILSTKVAQAFLDVFGDWASFEETAKTAINAAVELLKVLLQLLKTVPEEIKKAIDAWNAWAPGFAQVKMPDFGGVGGTGGGKVGGTSKATTSQRAAIVAAAKALGTTPENLANVISYETGGTFNPAMRGGKGNRHIGLIQFGPSEQAQFGAHQGQSFEEQMGSVTAFLKARGFKPGMSILDLYSTINAGRPGRYNASDVPGKTVATHTAQMMGGHRRRALAWLAGGGGGDELAVKGGTGEGGILPPSDELVREREQQMEMIKKQFETHDEWIQSQKQERALQEALLEGDKQRHAQLEALAEAQKQGFGEGSPQYQAILKEIQANDALVTSREALIAQRAQIEEINQALAGAASGFVQDIMAGVKASEALSNMLNRLAGQLVDMAIQNLFSFGGQQGGLLGALFGGVGGKVPAFQHGGNFRVAGSGGTDSSLVAFRATPGEMVSVSPRRLGHGGRGAPAFNVGGAVINIAGSADERTVALMDRKLARAAVEQRRALERDWGSMSKRYSQLRAP